MSGLEFRYVGQDRLPTRLSEFDVERYFALTDNDIAAINERFRRDRRAGAAIQLVFLRASGHTLDHVGILPRQLLRYVGERLGLPTPTIASLRTLYQRYKTQYEHQVWACEYLGLASVSPDQRAGLEAWMRQDAAESLTLDELTQHAHYWLYGRRLLIPAERTLRDLGRSIWSDIERGLLAMIETAVLETQLVRADAVLSTPARHVRHDRSRMAQNAASAAQPDDHHRNPCENPFPQGTRRTYLDAGCCADREAACLRAAHSGSAARKDPRTQGVHTHDRADLFPTCHAAGAHGRAALSNGAPRLGSRSAGL